MTALSADPWNKPGVRLDRVSLNYYVGQGLERSPARPRPEDSHYGHMLVDDVSMAVLPTSGLVGDRSPVFVLSGADAAAERMIVAAFSLPGSYGAENLSEALCEWGRESASQLLSNGRAVHELAFRVDEDGSPVGFSVLPLSGHEIVRYGWRWYQVVPRGAARPTEGAGTAGKPIEKRRIYLPRDRLVVVQKPRGGPAPYRMVKRLAHLDWNQYPTWSLPDPLQRPRDRVPFDFERFIRTDAVTVAAVTRTVGWNARGTFGDWETEYYAAARYLRLQRFICGVRVELARSINEIIGRAGKRLGFRAQVRLQRVPTATQVAAAELALSEGTITPAELYFRFSLL